MRVEPFGFEIENWRAGMIAATVSNSRRSKRGKALQPADFYPPIAGVRKYQLTPEQQDYLDRKKRRDNSRNGNS
jgi:hypothetical protein